MPRPTSPIRLTVFQQHVAVGTLLGDSSLIKPPSGLNYHLSCYHAEKQREWLLCKHAWLSPASRPIQWCAYLDKRNGKIRAGGRFHTVSIPCFTRLAALLYHGRVKVVTEDFLTLFTHPVALTCLIADDGSWDQAGIAIASKHFSIAENAVLAKHLSTTFGLTITVQDGGPYPYIRITARSVEKAILLCAPFLPPSLRYKFGPEGYATRLVGKIDQSCPVCGTGFQEYALLKRLYCSRKCANIGRPKGYAAQHKTSFCERCAMPFVLLNKRQTRCKDCRELRLEAIPCPICTQPVWKTGNMTCSARCNVLLGHRNRR